MRIAVLFDNLGPYHVARLSALTAHCTLLAVERRTISAEYAWSSAAQTPFHRVTLSDVMCAASGMDNLRQALDGSLDDFGAEVVFVPGWAGALAVAALLWANRRGVPAIVMSDSQESDFPRKAHSEWVKRRLVACCSGALVAGRSHSAYVAKLGIDKERIRVGYDVVDNDYFREGASRARAQAAALSSRHGLPARYFLTSARFIEKKNLSGLLDAFAAFQERRRDCNAESWHLVILGDGGLRPALERQVAALGLADTVSMPGFKQYPELPVYYGLAEAFILASTTEQWGLVINEAMASGLPVIASSRCGAAGDLVLDGVNGFKVDPCDVGELAQRMAFLAESTERRSSMGRASGRIIEEWSPAVFSANAMELAEMSKNAPRRRPGPVDRLVVKAMLSLHER